MTDNWKSETIKEVAKQGPSFIVLVLILVAIGYSARYFFPVAMQKWQEQTTIIEGVGKRLENMGNKFDETGNKINKNLETQNIILKDIKSETSKTRKAIE